jgi:ABC-type antimicrobial peptide transport system permease subunit
MTLGATRGDILRMVLREVFLVAALGIILGLAASLALTRLLVSQLVGIAPNDPAVFVAATLVLVLTALAAGWLPAHRAARLAPARVLQDDGGSLRAWPVASAQA